MSWEDSYDSWKTTPPNDPEPLMTDIFDNPIYEDEEYYNINGNILSVDGLEDCKEFFDDEDKISCGYCEEEIEEDFFYRINGECFCENCVKELEQTAYGD